MNECVGLCVVGNVCARVLCLGSMVADLIKPLACVMFSLVWGVVCGMTSGLNGRQQATVQDLLFLAEGICRLSCTRPHGR